MGRVLAAAGWGEGERGRDRNVLLAAAVCGGEVWRGSGHLEGHGRLQLQQQDGLPAPLCHEISWERDGSCRAQGPLQPAEPCWWVGWVCFVSGSQSWRYLSFVVESKAEGLFVPCLPHYLGGNGKGLGTALAVLPWTCLEMGSGGTVLCPSLQSVLSIPGWMGEPRRCQWSCSQLSLQPQAPSRAAFGRGSWAKPRAPYTVNQAVWVGSEPKPDRKGKKWVSFSELSLAPAETEGPMILHHFAFSLPLLTQTVPRTRCVLPGPAGTGRMPEQEHLSHEDAVGRPCSHLHCPRRELLPGSCSPVAHQ